MKTDLKYLIIKSKDKNKTINFNSSKLDGYQLIKNRKKIIHGVNVNNILVVDKFLIAKAVDKKISRKFKSLLELIASVYENDEDPGNGIRYALNEIEKFKRMMINQYVVYMDKKQVEKLNRKVKLIEQEVNMRMFQCSQKYNEEIYEEEKSNHRTR